MNSARRDPKLLNTWYYLMVIHRQFELSPARFDSNRRGAPNYLEARKPFQSAINDALGLSGPRNRVSDGANEIDR